LAAPARAGAAIDWPQQARLVAADGASGDRLGSAVAIDGDTAVAGALLAPVDGHVAQGAVYVFQRVGTTWTLQTRLAASDGAAFDRFGASLALDGDTLLVGAWGADANRGAAWVFTRHDGIWTQQARLAASDGIGGLGGDLFGEALALDGDTALIGAWSADIDGQSDQGAVYTFVRHDGVWSEEHKFTVADGASGDAFGEAVALDGNTALVGARFAKVGDQFLQGAAYVFERAGGTWSEPEKLVAADGAALDRFGFSTALSGDTALIGALGASCGKTPNCGAAYVFGRDGDTWTQQARLVAEDGADGDDFAQFLALDGGVAVIGADFATVGGNALQGAAYVFSGSGADWSGQARLVAADGAEYDGFGANVAISGRTVVVGSELADVDGIEDRGAACVFVGPPVDVVFRNGFDAP
jgi:hypothetical protein